MERLFVDTSAWHAYLYRADPDHRAVRKVLGEFKGRLVTSNFVLDEAVTLCAARHGHSAGKTIGTLIFDSGLVGLVRVTVEDERLAWALFGVRPDQQYSFTDCTSFVLMRRLGIRRAAALDDDFRREGFEVVPD